MSSVRPMKANDLFKFDDCNLDPFVETYNLGFYLEYLSRWPDLCRVIEGSDGRIEGYILAKVESSPYPCPNPPYDPRTNTNPNYLPWHGHITALTVAPKYRRLGHATRLSEALEQSCDAQQAWFVDLFVRTDNKKAIGMYRKMGYSVWRRVVGYYADGCDAFDMRKTMSRDVKKGTVREGGEQIEVDPSEVW